ncbi:MAG: hypothetical protein F9K29_10165 [Hyphomicrobiaceae bacterium]|nr:MAG: hypothetical protein F9K29_10165 [Hyphomicrobiaceae bacterium]
MHVAQISDTHIQTRDRSARSRLDDLDRTVASINALRPRPAAVLHTGDVAHDGAPSDYAAAREILCELACPVFATVGNKDGRGAFRQAFAPDGYMRGDAGFVQYAVELGALRVVAVDTLDADSNLGAFCAAREADLRRLLSSPAELPTLVFLHHAPVPLPDMARQPLQFRDPRRAAALARCIAECRNVIGVVAGHVHRTRLVAFEETMLSTAPSIAADLSKEKLPGRYAGRPVYHLHAVDGARMASASVLVEP